MYYYYNHRRYTNTATGRIGGDHNDDVDPTDGCWTYTTDVIVVVLANVLVPDAPILVVLVLLLQHDCIVYVLDLVLIYS